MKYLLIFLFCFFSIQTDAQDSIPNYHFIQIINDYYDVKFENKADETWYYYVIPGMCWKKGIKNGEDIWLPYHRLTKIEFYKNQVIKTDYRLDKISVSQVLKPDSTHNSINSDIDKLPTYFENSLVKRGCSSELPILIRCTDKIEFYELPICPFIRIKEEDKLKSDFETMKKQAELYMKVCEFIDKYF